MKVVESKVNKNASRIIAYCSCPRSKIKYQSISDCVKMSKTANQVSASTADEATLTLGSLQHRMAKGTNKYRYEGTISEKTPETT